MKKWLAIVAFAALVVGVGGIAYAAIPSADGVIHGCYKTSNPAKGSVIVVDAEAGETCPSSFVALNWSQTGPQGPPGLSGVHVVTAFVQSVSQVLCPTNETALSIALGPESWSAAPVIDINGKPIGYDVGGAASYGTVHVTCAVTG